MFVLLSVTRGAGMSAARERATSLHVWHYDYDDLGRALYGLTREHEQLTEARVPSPEVRGTREG